MWQWHSPRKKVLLGEMAVYLSMFCVLTKNWIACNLDSTLVVIVKGSGSGLMSTDSGAKLIWQWWMHGPVCSFSGRSR